MTKKQMNSDFQKRKKILIATGIYPPDIGGPASYVSILEKELPKINFDVCVTTYADNFEQKKGVYQVLRGQNIFCRYLKYFWFVFKLIPSVDCVYVMGAVSEGLPAWLACKLRRKKYILKIVGDYAWEQSKQRFGVYNSIDDFQNKKYSWRVELMRAIQKKVANGAEKIIVPSQYLKKIVSGWVIDVNKIFVVYNSVDRLEEENISSKKIDLKGDIILSAGRLVSWKGFDTLIDLMPELLKENPNFKLVIIGDGPFFEKYKTQIEKRDLAESVKLLGRVEQKKLWEYMKVSRIFVLNTGYEGLSHVLIEAMLVGAPIVATNTGGNPELIEDNVSGLLIEFNNKKQIKETILKLWKDKCFADRLAFEAQKKARKNFSREKMISDLLKVL